MQQRMTENVGPSPAGLFYGRKVFGSPWPTTAIVNLDGTVLWPLTFFRGRLQWWLLYTTSGQQVYVGDEVKMKRQTYIVAEIRMGGRIMVEGKKQTWVSPADIDARWHEYQAGRLVHAYGRQ